jgi:hypothetical protein
MLTNPAKRRCFVHAGTHKTGTTSIQTFLRDNRDWFGANGVLIPRSGRSENDAGHHNLALQLLGLPDFVPERGGLQELTGELRASDLDTACISSENFSHLARRPDVLVRLRDAILAAGYTPLVVMYLRPQVSYVVSIYAEIVKNGHLKPFDVYRREIAGHGSFFWGDVPGPTFHYDLLLDSFAAVFGRDAIVARRYDSGARNNALLESFAALIAGRHADPAGLTFPIVRENATLTFAGVLREFDLELGTKLDRELGADDLRFTPLDVRGALFVSLAFLRSNVNLYRKYGIWVAPCDLKDLYWALPVRKNGRRTRGIRFARQALASVGERLA